MGEKLTEAQWRAEGALLFGPDVRRWRFICPVCKTVASVQDYDDAGAPEGAIGFSCIGRYKPEPRDAFYGKGSGPCNYAGGGLFRLNPVTVVGEDREYQVFAFAVGDAGRQAISENGVAS